MKLKMIQSMASSTFALAPGDIYDCDDAEGQRLIDAGIAEAAPAKAEVTFTKSPDVAPPAEDAPAPSPAPAADPAPAPAE